jgi:hypothetical protein
MHEETGRLDIELLADVFANLDQIVAALTAGAGFRFMAVFDARQVLGQRLTTGPRAWRRRRRGRCRGIRQPLGHLGLSRCQIAGQGFLKQVALLSGQSLIACAETHPAQVGQFQGKCLDFGLGGEQLAVAVRDLCRQAAGFAGVFLRLIQQVLKRARDPVRERGVRLEAGQFSVEIHARIIP